MDTKSQQMGRGQKKHYYTPSEDKALIDALVELFMDPLNIESSVKLLRTKIAAIFDILCMNGFDWNYETNTIMCEKSANDEHGKVGIMIFGKFSFNEIYLFICLIFFCNAIQVHKEAAGLYGKSFSFFY